PAPLAPGPTPPDPPLLSRAINTVGARCVRPVARATSLSGCSRPASVGAVSVVVIAASPAAATELASTVADAAETRDNDKSVATPPDRYRTGTARPWVTWR